MTRKTRGDIRLYHVDHLGSTSLVTDIDGEITQHVAYIPYGEVFIEERNGSWSTPYLFNAKELDEETGLYYYGARYLDPTHAAWLSVDPLFEKYVGMTPYNYCAGNPVKLVDPDGTTLTTAAEEMAGEMVRFAVDKISEINVKIDKGVSDEKLQEYKADIKRYKDAIMEINTLRESDQMYDFKTYYQEPYTDYNENNMPYERNSAGFVSYDQDTKTFIINVNTYYAYPDEIVNLGDFAHELKHGYQFETGRLSMRGKTSSGMANGGYLYDYTDEKEAHQRGADFGSRMPESPDPNVYSKHKKKDLHVTGVYLHRVATWDTYKNEIYRNKYGIQRKEGK